MSQEQKQVVNRGEYTHGERERAKETKVLVPGTSTPPYFDKRTQSHITFMKSAFW